MLTPLLGMPHADHNPRWRKSGGKLYASHEIIRGRNLVKTHSKAFFIPKGAKIIHLVRDGRDAVFSYYHWNVKNRGLKETWEEWFTRYVWEERMKFDREIYLSAWMGNWSENFLSYQEWGKKNDRVPFLVRYEDLRSDPRNEMERILDFLGIGVEGNEIVEAIAKNKQMRGNRNYKRGAIEGWRDRLTEEQITEFQTRHGVALRMCGYEE